ncbi:MAG: PadR family transcriptional regulator [Oligoflexia bacterium]|nr:PadR family transcriptional regulator [Oligoflexia bacterium]MBF0367495.1 PadR family transcriptional regulator [Oligoflexia bacterium]
MNIDNWKSQIRKGYLDLCILLLIETKKRIYGFELLDVLRKLDLPVKEGTLYPLLSRMSSDGLLNTEWETESSSGHPRKFYSLTKTGKHTVSEMQSEFDQLIKVYKEINKLEK